MFNSTVVKNVLMNSMPAIKKSGSIFLLGLMLGFSKSKPAEAIFLSTSLVPDDPSNALVLQDSSGNNITVGEIRHSIFGQDKNNDGRLTYSLIAVDNEIELWNALYFSTNANGDITGTLYNDPIVLNFNPIDNTIPYVTTNVDGTANGNSTNEVLDLGERDVFLDCTIDLGTGTCSDISWNTDANNTALGFPLEFLITSSSQSPVSISVYENGVLSDQATGNFFTEVELANQPDPDTDPDTNPQAVPESTSIVSLMILGGFLLRYSKKYVS